MSSLEVTEKMGYQVQTYHAFGIDDAIMNLNSGEGEYRNARKPNKYYRRLARHRGVQFFKTKNRSFKKRVSEDGLHPAAHGIRYFARDFWDFQKF